MSCRFSIQRLEVRHGATSQHWSSDANKRLAARSAREGYRALGIMFDKPFPFLDSDVYKWLEAAGSELGREWNAMRVWIPTTPG